MAPADPSPASPKGPDREALTEYLASMDRAGGGIYTADFRNGFRHALAMLASYESGDAQAPVREAAREALSRRPAPDSAEGPDEGLRLERNRLVNTLSDHAWDTRAAECRCGFRRASTEDTTWAEHVAEEVLRLPLRQVDAVRRALDDELANLADDGARLSHSVVRRIEAALSRTATEGTTVTERPEGPDEGLRPGSLLFRGIPGCNGTEQSAVARYDEMRRARDHHAAAVQRVRNLIGSDDEIRVEWMGSTQRAVLIGDLIAALSGGDQ